MKNNIIHILVFVLGSLGLYGQQIPEKGVPHLQNFKPSQYANMGKIWAIDSSPNGLLFMAADGGLVVYDGKTWATFKGSKGFTRSLLVVDDSTIYSGSDLDFGVWNKNRFQEFEYTSLYPFQKEVNEFYEEFWHVHQLDDGIAFSSFQNIYVYKNQQLTRIAAPSKFTGSFKVKDSLFFADEKEGVFLFSGYSLRQVFKFPEQKKMTISGMYQHAEGLVMVTESAGLYLFSGGSINPIRNLLSEELKSAKVFSFEQLDRQYLAFGTILKGLYITDLSGNIIHHINKNKGLPNSTILSLHYSKWGKLWMGMDYGLASLDLNNSVYYFIDYNGDFGTGSTALIEDDIFYVGTNQGLYRSKWSNMNNDKLVNSFDLESGTEGQVWSLEMVENTLMIGHDKGLFALEGGKLRILSDRHGVLSILPCGQYLLAGNYNGISIFEKKGGEWVFVRMMDLIYGSCSQLLMESEHVLWVNIPNFGVIRAVLDQNMAPVERLIFEEDTFEGDFLTMSKNKNGIQLATNQAAYMYDTTEKKFLLQQEHNQQLKVEDLLPGYYHARPLNNNYNFYPVYNGFALEYLQNSTYKADTMRPKVVLRKIQAMNAEYSTKFFDGAVVPYTLNSLRIECVVPNHSQTLLQYILDDNTQWSALNIDHRFDLINLKPGKHVIGMRAEVDGELTETLYITLVISPPWYRTIPAYVVYFLLLLLGFFLVHRHQKAGLKKQKENLLRKEQESLRSQAEKHEQDILRLEQDLIKNQNEQLKEQLKNKTIELATKAKDNEDKNRLLLMLKEKCDLAQKEPVMTKVRLSEMQRLLESYLSIEDRTFEIQMDELHQEFFKKLKERFPNLSSNDLRWCAYLKIGLNSKEIAEILNIQPSSSYIGRSRLRKKLNLNPEEDLYTFLNEI